MLCTLSDIDKVCGPVLGSITNIKLLLPADMLSSTRQGCNMSISEPDLKENAQYYLIAHLNQTGSFVEKRVTNSKNGHYYEATISFNLLQIRYAVDRIAGMLANQRVHVAFTDLNGIRKICYNMRLQEESSTGAKYSDRNGYQFNFYSKSIHKSPDLPSVEGGTGGFFILDPDTGLPILTGDGDGITIPQ